MSQNMLQLSYRPVTVKENGVIREPMEEWELAVIRQATAIRNLPCRKRSRKRPLATQAVTSGFLARFAD